MNSYDELLAEIASYPIEMRALAFTALLTNALKEARFPASPILVGGAAVEFWSRGLCTTADIDLVLYTPHKVVDATMALLGFVNTKSRYWLHPVYDFLVEFPDDTLSPELVEQTLRIEGGFEARIITAESAVADRLASFSLNGNTIDAGRAVLVAHARGNSLDWDEVIRMTSACLVPQDLVARVRQYVQGHADLPFPEEGKMRDELYYLYRPETSVSIESEDQDDA